LEAYELPIIINDAKLFAQAELEATIKFFVASDRRSLKMYELLKDKCNLNFEFIDIKIDHTETFGILDL